MSQSTQTQSKDAVHVWKVLLNVGEQALPHLTSLLSTDELLRADRFTFPEGRRRYIATRGSLRKILGRCLAADPVTIAFGTGSHGKPFLLAADADKTSDARRHELRFNVSHTDDLAVIAVAWGREVGIDIEKLDREVDMEGLARRFFSPAEALAVLNADKAMRKQMFFRIWTTKEAYIKARGEGLSLPLDQFDVVTDLSRPPGLVATRHDPEDAQRWQFAAVEIENDCACTLAAEAGFSEVRLMMVDG